MSSKDPPPESFDPLQKGGVKIPENEHPFNGRESAVYPQYKLLFYSKLIFGYSLRNNTPFFQQNTIQS